jgi:hypothetical protein
MSFYYDREGNIYPHPLFSDRMPPAFPGSSLGDGEYHKKCVDLLDKYARRSTQDTDVKEQ